MKAWAAQTMVFMMSLEDTEISSKRNYNLVTHFKVLPGSLKGKLIGENKWRPKQIYENETRKKTVSENRKISPVCSPENEKL